MNDIEKLQDFLNRGLFYLQRQNSDRATQNLKIAGGYLESLIVSIERTISRKSDSTKIDKKEKNGR